jgi:hypothetical protein
VVAVFGCRRRRLLSDPSPPPFHCLTKPQAGLTFMMLPGKILGMHYQHNRIK